MTSPSPSEMPSAFHIPRILSIESDPLIQKMTDTMLEILGAQCISTNYPSEALELFQQEYDLVLLDLRLTGMTGFELAERMRTIDIALDRHTPIIGHATLANPEEVEPLCLSAGMDAVYPKFTSVQAVYEVLTQWLSRPLIMPMHLLDVHVPLTKRL